MNKNQIRIASIVLAVGVGSLAGCSPVASEQFPGSRHTLHPPVAGPQGASSQPVIESSTASTRPVANADTQSNSVLAPLVTETETELIDISDLVTEFNDRDSEDLTEADDVLTLPVTVSNAVSTIALSGTGLALAKMAPLTRVRLADASGTSVTSGAGSGNATSHNDAASITCAFTTDTGSVNTATTGIQIVTGSAPSINSCTNKNACILCTTAATGANCSIACTGTLPSNSATDSDSFNIYVTYVGSMTTTMEFPGGMIRVDGKISSWPEFAFNGQLNSPSFSTVATNYAGCNGTSSTLEAYSGTGSLGDALAIANSTATAFTDDPAIIAVGNGNCVISYEFKASMPFTGVQVPGTAINLSRGTVSFAATICDSISSSCTAPAL